MSKYRERLLKEAEEMAKIKYNRTFEDRIAFDDLDQASKDNYVEMWDMLPLAANKLEGMALSCRNGIIEGAIDGHKYVPKGSAIANNDNINDYLISEGLIES